MIEEPQELSTYPGDFPYEGSKRRGSDLHEETTTTKRTRVDEEVEDMSQALVAGDKRERELTISRIDEEAMVHHATRLEMHQENYHNIIETFSGSIKSLGKDCEEQVMIKVL